MNQTFPTQRGVQVAFVLLAYKGCVATAIGW